MISMDRYLGRDAGGVAIIKYGISVTQPDPEILQSLAPLQPDRYEYIPNEIASSLTLLAMTGGRVLLRNDR